MLPSCLFPTSKGAAKSGKTTPAVAVAGNGGGAMEPSAWVTVRMVADPMCPWTWIGRRNLAAAAERLSARGLGVRLEVLPFQLDPSLPMWPATVTKRERYSAKRGRPVNTWEDRATPALLAANEAGPRIPFTVEGSISNTMPVLRVLHAAARQGRSAEVFDGVARAFHEEGANMSDPAVLGRVCAAAGVDLDVEDYLAGEGDVNAVHSASAYLRMAGVTGVPTFIVGDDHRALVGGQTAAALERVISRVGRENAELAASSDGDGSTYEYLHATVCTSNLAKAVSFYRDGLGLLEVTEPSYSYEDMGVPGHLKRPSMRLKFSARAAQELHLVEVEDNPARNIGGVGPHVCIYVPGTHAFDKIIRQLSNIGVDTSGVDVNPLGGRAFLKDFDGNTVELDTTPPHPARGNPPAELALHHMAVNFAGRDLATPRSFYTDIIGLPLLSGNWLRLGDCELHVVPKGSFDPPTSEHQHIAVRLPGKAFDTAVAKAQKDGSLQAKVSTMGRSAYIADRLGHSLVVVNGNAMPEE